MKALQLKETLVFSFAFLQISPTIGAALANMMRNRRGWLKQHQPTAAHHAQGPFAVLAIHVEAFIKPADIINHCSPNQECGSTQHANAATVRMVPMKTKQQIGAQTLGQQSMQTQCCHYHFKRREWITPNAGLQGAVRMN